MSAVMAGWASGVGSGAGSLAHAVRSTLAVRRAAAKVRVGAGSMVMVGVGLVVAHELGEGLAEVVREAADDLDRLLCRRGQEEKPVTV